MLYARVMYAKVIDSAPAATTSGGKRTAKGFAAKMMLFGPAGSAEPTSLEIDYISEPSIWMFNGTETAYAKDEIVQVGQSVQGTWFIIEGGGGSGGKIFKTPTGGIAKRVNLACVSKNCPEYILNDDDELEIVDANPENWLEVYNIWACDIFGNTFVTAKSVSGKWVVDAEDYIDPAALT